MDNGHIIDAAFALVLLLGMLLGARRGLFRSLMGLAALLAALLGAALLSEALTGPVTELLTPRAEQSVQEWFDGGRQDEARLPDGEEPSGAADGETADADGLLQRLLRFDFDGAVRDSLRSAAQDAALSAVETLLSGVVRTLLFVLSFLLLTLLLRLLTRGLGRVFDLPVLRTVNALGGAALGITESALLLFLACQLAPRLGVAAFAENEDGTYLLHFFMNNTPRSLIAALTTQGKP